MLSGMSKMHEKSPSDPTNGASASEDNERDTASGALIPCPPLSRISQVWRAPARATDHTPSIRISSARLRASR